MIKIADRIIQLYRNSDIAQPGKSGISNHEDTGELAVFFTAFMESLYPYHIGEDALRDDLTSLRLIAQQYIPQFNYLLNRKGIGL
jgi:hypothetical protein